MATRKQKIKAAKKFRRLKRENPSVPIGTFGRMVPFRKVPKSILKDRWRGEMFFIQRDELQKKKTKSNKGKYRRKK